MPGTFPILELKQDGDVGFVRVKQAGAKPALKDLQLYLKKRAAPALITSYPYGDKRISMFGYVKGKEDDISQHQLPPPCEASEIYGSIVLVAHTSKAAWDSSNAAIETFSPADYEVFYEKACSGELEEDVVVEGDEEEVVEEEEVEEEVVEEEEVEEGDALEDDEVGDAVDAIDAVDDEEEAAPRIRISRKVIKIDPQQLQFQFKSDLNHEDEPNAEAVNASKERTAVLRIMEGLLAGEILKEGVLDLEMGIFNAALDEAKRRMVPLTWKHETFRWIYGMISKRTVANIDSKSYVGNRNLILRWRCGEFRLRDVGSLSSYDLKPDQWKDLKDQQVRRDQRILEGNLSMATDRFRCSGCHKKMCSYYELQTRSADEPMTIFIKCLNCGKQWKQ